MFKGIIIKHAYTIMRRVRGEALQPSSSIFYLKEYLFGTLLFIDRNVLGERRDFIN